MKKLTIAAFLLASSVSLNVQATPIFSIEALGTLGGNESQAYGLNDVGQVVGYSTDASGNQVAFVWDSVTGMQSLGDPRRSELLGKRY